MFIESFQLASLLLSSLVNEGSSISSWKSYNCLPSFGTKTHIKNWQFYLLYFNNFLSFSFDLECEGWWCPMFQRSSPNCTRHKMTLPYVVFFANKSICLYYLWKFERWTFLIFVYLGSIIKQFWSDRWKISLLWWHLKIDFFESQKHE